MYIRCWLFWIYARNMFRPRAILRHGKSCLVHERDANRAEIGDLVADIDLDFDLPARSEEDFRKKFIEMSKSVRLSAG